MSGFLFFPVTAANASRAAGSRLDSEALEGLDAFGRFQEWTLERLDDRFPEPRGGGIGAPGVRHAGQHSGGCQQGDEVQISAPQHRALQLNPDLISRLDWMVLLESAISLFFAKQYLFSYYLFCRSFKFI
jgi:hypothetical protein